MAGHDKERDRGHAHRSNGSTVQAASAELARQGTEACAVSRPSLVQHPSPRLYSITRAPCRKVMGVTGPALAGSAERRRAARWRAEQGWLARLLGANRAGLDALPGDGSCEGQRRFAFLLYRQENISERTPHLLGRAVLCR